MSDAKTAGDGCVVVWRARLNIERVEVHTCGDTSGSTGPQESVWEADYVSVTGQTPFDVLTQMRDHVLGLVRRAGADLVHEDDDPAAERSVRVVGAGGVTEWTPQRGACLTDGYGSTVALFNGVSWVEPDQFQGRMEG